MLAALAALARSASAQMIIGSEPPSSSVTRLEPLAASAPTRSPVGVEPVNAILRTSGCVTSASPAPGPVPGTTLRTPGGQPGLGQDLGQPQGRERGRVGGLGDDRVAAQERRAELVAQQRGREVPRHDRRYDAERAAQHASVDARIQPVDVDATDVLGEASVVLERLGRLAQLDLSLADRLALLGDQQRHELLDVRVERLGACVQQHAAVGIAEPRPFADAAAAALRTAVSTVCGVGAGDAADQLAGRGVADRERVGLDRLRGPVDERSALRAAPSRSRS